MRVIFKSTFIVMYIVIFARILHTTITVAQDNPKASAERGGNGAELAPLHHWMRLDFAFSQDPATRGDTDQSGHSFSTQHPLSDSKKNWQKGPIPEHIVFYRKNAYSVKTLLSWLRTRLGLQQNAFFRLLMGFMAKPNLSVVKAMAWGDAHDLTQREQTNFKVIGMQHVLVASGSNIGLMVGLGDFLARRFGRIQRLVLLCGCVGLYVLLAVSSASLVRAVTVAILRLVSTLLLRRQLPATRALVWAAALMMIADHQIWKNIGFQLSIAASLGLLSWLPLLQSGGRWLALEKVEFQQPMTRGTGNWGQWWWRQLVDGWWTTVAAQLLTVPLVWYHFGEVAPLSLIANPLLLWLVPLITTTAVFGFFGQLVSSWWPFLTRVGAVLLGHSLQLMTQVLLSSAAFFPEAAIWQLPKLPLGQLLWWWWLCLFTAWWWRRKRGLQAPKWPLDASFSPRRTWSNPAF